MDLRARRALLGLGLSRNHRGCSTIGFGRVAQLARRGAKKVEARTINQVAGIATPLF